jgi:hypothetical protein
MFACAVIDNDAITYGSSPCITGGDSVETAAYRGRGLREGGGRFPVWSK